MGRMNMPLRSELCGIEKLAMGRPVGLYSSRVSCGSWSSGWHVKLTSSARDRESGCSRTQSTDFLLYDAGQRD